MGRNANILLNVPPTRDGVFHDVDARRLAEFAAKLRETFSDDHAARAKIMRTNEGIEVQLRKPASIGMIVLRERIERGQHVSKYRVEARVDGAWVTVSRGTTIGQKKIDRFAAVAAERVRVVIEKSTAPARLGEMSVFSQARQASRTNPSEALRAS